MNDFALFICGVVVTLIVGMGVITSQVFMGYKKFMQQEGDGNDKIKQTL